jgi:cephalosporin hydroxylase
MNVKKLTIFIINTRKKWKRFIHKKFFADIKSKKTIIDHFHELYYDSKKQTRKNTFFLGTIIFKCPLDLWIYQEIFFDLKPDIIIECGTAAGGRRFKAS